MLDKIKIDKELLWMKPYLNLAYGVDPRIERIKSIKLTHPQKNKVMRQYASVSWDDKAADITLMSGEWGYNLRNNFRTNLTFNHLTKIDLLKNLAHELSHLKLVWDGESDKHTPLRQMTESVFTIHFMELLMEEAYTSEEDENINRRKSERARKP